MALPHVPMGFPFRAQAARILHAGQPILLFRGAPLDALELGDALVADDLGDVDAAFRIHGDAVARLEDALVAAEAGEDLPVQGPDADPLAALGDIGEAVPDAEVIGTGHIPLG